MSKTNTAGVERKVEALVGRCGSCRFFLVHDEPWRRAAFPFIGRLSEEEGRHVALGYCIRQDEIGEGPRADADTCQHYETANNGVCVPSAQRAKGTQDSMVGLESKGG